MLGAVGGGKVDGGNYFVFTMIWWPPVQSGWMTEMSMRMEVVGVGRDFDFDLEVIGVVPGWFVDF
jgi:hypothetical protein